MLPGKPSLCSRGRIRQRRRVELILRVLLNPQKILKSRQSQLTVLRSRRPQRRVTNALPPILKKKRCIPYWKRITEMEPRRNFCCLLKRWQSFKNSMKLKPYACDWSILIPWPLQKLLVQQNSLKRRKAVPSIRTIPSSGQIYMTFWVVKNPALSIMPYRTSSMKRRPS